MYKYIALFINVALTLGYSLSYGSAANQQNNEPIIITADSFTLDYNKGYAVYTNHVSVNQSNRQLKSDHLFIYFDKEAKESVETADRQKANKFKSLVACSNDNNNPVIYLERNLNDSKLVTVLASAGTIKYEPELHTNKITLEKNAIIEQNNKKLMSELLYYDLKNEIATMPKVTNQRSKIILG